MIAGCRHSVSDLEPHKLAALSIAGTAGTPWTSERHLIHAATLLLQAAGRLMHCFGPCSSAPAPDRDAGAGALPNPAGAAPCRQEADSAIIERVAHLEKLGDCFRSTTGSTIPALVPSAHLDTSQDSPAPPIVLMHVRSPRHVNLDTYRLCHHAEPCSHDRRGLPDPLPPPCVAHLPQSLHIRNACMQDSDSQGTSIEASQSTDHLRCVALLCAVAGVCLRDPGPDIRHYCNNMPAVAPSHDPRSGIRGPVRSKHTPNKGRGHAFNTPMSLSAAGVVTTWPRVTMQQRPGP